MARQPRTLREELKQTKRFPSLADETCVAILRTADVVRGLFESRTGGTGITLQQYNVLRILRGAHPDLLPTLEIAGRMIERAPGITRLLDRLETAGLVRRERCSQDRRRVLCRITPAGLAMLDKVTGPLEAAGRTWAGRLPRGDLEQLLRLLGRLRDDTS